MPNYQEPIGKGGLWIKEGKKGKFFSGEITFQYNGHSVTLKMLGFKNEQKEGQRPDYNLLAIDAFPTKEKKVTPPPQKEENDIPF